MLCTVLAFLSSKEMFMAKKPAATDRCLLRHTLATLAYRGGKVIRGAPANFSQFRAGDSTRTPGQILAHINDVLDWGLTLAKGAQKYRASEPLSWEKDAERFHASLRKLDSYLASKKQLACSTESLFQGPVADVLTHIGQIAMLRRLAGSPLRAENYQKATIKAGSVGARQAQPKQEF